MTNPKPASAVTAADLGDHPAGQADTDPGIGLFDWMPVCEIILPMPVTEFVKLSNAIDRTFGKGCVVRFPQEGDRPDRATILIRRRTDHTARPHSVTIQPTSPVDTRLVERGQDPQPVDNRPDH